MDGNYQVQILEHLQRAKLADGSEYYTSIAISLRLVSRLIEICESTDPVIIACYPEYDTTLSFEARDLHDSYKKLAIRLRDCLPANYRIRKRSMRR